MKNYLIYLVLLVITTMPGFAQEGTASFSEESTFSVEGTSTLHNWTATVSGIEGSITLSDNFLEAGKLTSNSTIKALSLHIPVAGMDGGKDVMNAKMHRALLEETHPHITFELTEATLQGEPASTGTFSISTKGNLQIAGVSQTVEMTVEGEIIHDSQIKFTGQHSMKMSDHNIDPPTAMFGQIATGDEITVRYSLVVNP